MSLIDVNIDEYQEPQMVATPDEPLKEADFRIADVEKKFKESTGNEWLQIILKPEDEDTMNPAIVYHRLFLPKTNDEPGKRNAKIGFIKRFCDAVDYIPTDGQINTEDLFGLTGRAVFKYVNGEEGISQPKNEVQRFIRA